MLMRCRFSSKVLLDRAAKKILDRFAALAIISCHLRTQTDR
jgi:hypothetical protein